MNGTACILTAEADILLVESMTTRSTLRQEKGSSRALVRAVSTAKFVKVSLKV